MKECETYSRAREMLAKAGLRDDTIKQLERDFHYFDAPASKGHHLSVRGGLARHSVNVTERLVDLTQSLGVGWPRAESPYLVGMLHDLVKCRCYRAVTGTEQDKTPKWEYVQPLYGGHGAASVMLAMSDLGVFLYPPEAAAIRWHMGAFCLAGDELKEYDRALDEWPLELIAAHSADMLAARVDETNRLNAVQPSGLATQSHQD